MAKIYIIGSENARKVNANIHIYSVPDGKGDRKHVEAIGTGERADCFATMVHVVDNKHEHLWPSTEVLFAGDENDVRYIETLSGYNTGAKAPELEP